MLDTFNPVFILFTSYGLGVLATGIVQKIGFLPRFEDHNYISDQSTKRLGVLKLGWVIRNSFLSRFNPRLRVTSRPTKSSLSLLRHAMTLAENSHLMAFLIFSVFLIHLIVTGSPWWQIIVYASCNIFFNLYLVFLQQYNKRRIDQVLERLA